MYTVEYFNSNASVWNFCLNVFKAYILLQIFPTSHNIGKIKQFQYNFTPLQVKYCFHKNLYYGSRLIFTELHKEIDFCGIYIE